MPYRASILVVDDQTQIRRVLQATLSSIGFIVGDARTCEEALAAVRQDRPDLILLDVDKPGIGGIETCRILRASCDVPIIMLSVRNTERAKVDALDAGADDYVVKPFSIIELVARIRANLRRTSSTRYAPEQTIILGELTVTLAARRVTVRGKKVRLTPKEFALLEMLVTNANVTVSHEKLLKTVWGPDSGTETKYLHVFINQIRKKIELEPRSPQLILSEPGQGYRFVTH